MSNPNQIPVISGKKFFDVEVVGESHYQKHLAKICGQPSADGIAIEIDALLILEDDNKFDKKAVMVSINGGTVGYLDRDTAREFRSAVRSGGLSEYRVFQCAALIRGGWNRGPKDIGLYGVSLDLPNDD